MFLFTGNSKNNRPTPNRNMKDKLSHHLRIASLTEPPFGLLTLMCSFHSFVNEIFMICLVLVVKNHS